MTVIDMRKRPVNEKSAFISGLKHARSIIKDAERSLGNKDAFDLLQALTYSIDMAIEKANAVDA